jgi:SAM-dependent methyltransferase
MHDERRIDEVAFAGAEHLDEAYVAGYERKARADPREDLDLLRAHGLGPASTLIDFGAGTGTFAVAASSLCKRVVAVDVSPAMVDAIRHNVRECGATNVECVPAGFLSYQHDGAPADFVYTRNALHHLPDYWKGIALCRLADLLRPGGVLRLRDLVYSFDLTEAEAGIARWIDTTAAENAEDGWTRAEFETHVREEYSTFTWLLEPMLERAGFEIDTAAYAAIGAYADYVCVKRHT